MGPASVPVSAPAPVPAPQITSKAPTPPQAPAPIAVPPTVPVAQPTPRVPTNPPSKLPSNGFPLTFPVALPPPINSEGMETCGRTTAWEFAPGTTRHPVIPCTKHSDCADFFDKDVVFGSYTPCCLYRRCICGSTFFETTAQAEHCALFQCTTDVECPGGSCQDGVCDFSNVV